MPGPTDPTPPTVAVVGGGISGLTAAWEINRLRPDVRVVVLEGAPRVGGKLSLIEVGGLTLDGGAEALLARRPEALDLARQVGLQPDLVTPETTSAGVWTRGQVRPLPRRTVMGIPAFGSDAVGVLTEAEAARVDAEPSEPAAPVEDDIDVASYVAGRVGPAVVDRLVEPLLGGVYAGHADRLSLRATVPAVWAAAHSGTSLVAAARAQVGPAASEGTVPAPVFAGLAGGVGRLPLEVGAALTRAGVRVRTGVTVRELRRLPAGGDPGAAPRSGPGAGAGEAAPARWQLVLGSRADEQLLEVDAVVLAVPARPAGRLLAGVSGPAAALLGGVEAASMALVVAILPGARSLVSDAGSGFLVPPVEERLVKAVTYSSAKWRWLADQAGPDLVVRLSVGRQGDETMLQRPDDELAGMAISELTEALGAPLPTPTETTVVRWGGGLPQYAVGHVSMVESLRSALSSVPGLSLCGAYLDGLGVPACIAAARRAAAEVMADLPGRSTGPGRTMGG